MVNIGGVIVMGWDQCCTVILDFSFCGFQDRALCSFLGSMGTHFPKRQLDWSPVKLVMIILADAQRD